VVIPANAVIAVEKVRDYLLKPHLKDDKAKYLAQAGYTRAEYKRLALIFEISCCPEKQYSRIEIDMVRGTFLMGY
jgi:hypothetical protein